MGLRIYKPEETLMDAPEVAERVLKIIAETLGDVPIDDIAMSKSLNGLDPGHAAQTSGSPADCLNRS
jgi:hypothetical protein